MTLPLEAQSIEIVNGLSDTVVNYSVGMVEGWQGLTDYHKIDFERMSLWDVSILQVPNRSQGL